MIADGDAIQGYEPLEKACAAVGVSPKLAPGQLNKILTRRYADSISPQIEPILTPKRFQVEKYR